IRKCVEEANRSTEKTRRRVTSHLNKSNTVKDEEEEEEENDYEIETTRLNNQKQELNFPLRRRTQRQSK
ncbi:unnamed protein product, partial [Rotaria magnacalcarata]